MKKILSVALMAAVLVIGPATFAGTLFFKDGNKLSDVKIINITEGRITIEKDKVKKTFALGKIASFFDTDIEGGTSEEFLVDDFIDYKVTAEVEMPKHGETKDKTASCKISYTIRRIYEKEDKDKDKDKDKEKPKKNPNRVKYPYFYLFVLTSSSEETGSRGEYMFFYPDQAKIKAKGYDQAAILSNLTKLDRPLIHFDNVDGFSHQKNLSLGQREFEIPLKKIKGRTIIAYHLEVWGNKEIVGEKDWTTPGAKVGPKWWERY